MEITRKSLYVGNLHPNVDEAALNDKFSTVGEIYQIHLCRNSTNNVSLGYAYVTFESHAHAKEALDKMNFDYLLNRPMRMMWANSNSTLRTSGVGNIFIKNLHENITDLNLYDTFEAFGEILSSRVALDDNNRSKGYAFIHYATQEAADKAIKMTNGMSLLGKIVYVGPFKKKHERQRELDELNGSRAPKNVESEQLKLKRPENLNRRQDRLYVGYLEKSIDGKRLRQMFQPFGTVVSAKVRLENGVSRGFGFVSFSSPQEAEEAINKMNGSPCGNKTLKVSLAEGKVEYDGFLNSLKSQVPSNDREQPGPSSLANETISKNVNGPGQMRKLYNPEEIDLDKYFENYDGVASTSLNSTTSCNSGDVTGDEQPGPSSLGQETATKLSQMRRQRKKKNGAKSKPVNEESIPLNDNSTNQQGGQFNETDRKRDSKNASKKQEVAERTAVEATSSANVNRSIKSRNLNGNITKSMPSNNQPSTAGKEKPKPQYWVRDVDEDQRDYRYVRKPGNLTLGSFITFK